MAYGKPVDRLKLEAVSRLEDVSGSEWLIRVIRSRYEAVYGLAPPESVLPKVKK